MSTSKPESQVQAEIRLALSMMPGYRIFRNNVAKIKSPSGRWVDYGLGVGTSDLIGFRSVKITNDMVGKSIAQFVAIECKAKGGRETKEQQAFRKLVNSFGGISLVVDDAKDVKPLLATQPDP